MRTHVTPITNDAMDGFPFGFSEVCGNVGGAEHAVRHPAERLAARKDDGFISPSEKRAHHLKSYASLQVVFADERDQDGATETASAPLASAKKILGLFDKRFFGILFGDALRWHDCLRRGFSGSDAKDVGGEAFELAHGC